VTLFALFMGTSIHVIHANAHTEVQSNGKNKVSDAALIMGKYFTSNPTIYNSQNTNQNIKIDGTRDSIKLDFPEDFHFSKNISGNGIVIKEGPGSLTLSGENSYRGGTYIDDGKMIGTTGSLQGAFYSRKYAALVFDQGFNGEFQGIINGPGKVIVKNGAIKFNWSNSKAYIGSMEVEGGQAIINSKQNIEHVMIHQSGILSGMGIIAGKNEAKTRVINSGIVNPGNSLGTLRIEGDYQQTAGGKLIIEIAEQGHDKLEVAGRATLDGTLQVNVNEYVPPKEPKEFTVVETTEGVKGKFSREELEKSQGALKLKVIYEDPKDGKRVKVAIEREQSFEGKTPMQKEVAKAAEKKGAMDKKAADPEGGATGKAPDAELRAKREARDPLKEAVVSLQSIPPEKQGPYLEQLIPTLALSLKEVFFNAANVQYAQLADRLGAVREGVAGMSLNGLSQEPMTQQMNSHEEKLMKGGSFLEGPKTSPWKIFANASGIFSKITSAADLPRQSAVTGYFSVGGDYQINKHMSAGIYGGYQGIRSWYADGSWLKSNGVKFGLYGTGEWNHFYVNTMVGGGFSGVELKRAIYTAGGKQWMAGSRPTVWEINSLLGGGYELPLGAWRIGINNSIQYTYLGISSFKESGARNLGVQLGRQNPNSLVTTLGGSIAYRWELGDHCAIVPKIGLSWQREFLNYGQWIPGAFVGGPGFYLTSTTGARNNAFGTAGCMAQLGRHVAAYGYYNPQFGGGDIVAHAFLIGLNYNF